jgi:Skp family chaperone for outer membrane proteins
MSMNRTFGYFIALCALPLTAVNAEVRIATVDVGRILNESPDAAGKKKELDGLQQNAKKKADEKRAALQALETKLKENKIAEDSKEADAFRNEAKEYARFVRDSEEDLKKKFMKVNREITDKAMGRIAAYAKSNNIDIVLDKSEKYRTPVLFGNPAVDITDQVIQGLED